jgi:DNA-binding NarL/FixJ family response regulator
MDDVKLVFADNHKGFRSSVTTFLSRQRGIRVVAEAENGIEALQYVREYSPAILLLDMRMPHLDGLAVLQTMGAENICVKVLAFSVYDEEEYVHGLYGHGGSGYLLKDESPQMLFSVLMRIAEGESGFYSAAIAQILRSWGHQFEDRLNSSHA